MMPLWIGIALLTAVAISFVFWPLLRARKHQQLQQADDRREQNIEIFRDRVAELEAELESGSLEVDAFEQLKLELEKNLLIDAEQPETEAKPLKLTTGTLVTVSLMAVLIPALAFGLYAKLGRSVDLELALNKPVNTGEKPARSLEDAVAMLETELAERPENAEGWYMLATTYIGMQRYKEGLEAFRKVLTLLPEDAPQYPGVMGQYAQALFFSKGGKMDDEVRVQVERTLTLEPYEITTLGLMGIDAFGQQNYQAAIDHWSKGLINAEGKAAESLRSGIASATAKLKEQGIEVVAAPAPAPELKPAEIRLQLSIPEALRADLSPDQTVFVFARPVGGRMPLAALRLTLSQLPLEVVLNDSLAMSPQAKLSQVEEVEVTARISLSGQPQASSGDLFGTLSPVAVRGDGVPLTMVIDQIVD
ncbi:MAG: c-type cytochrome biogenesis protein CcmI [Pontibacterium sp.]